jgi:hypothetical protein
VGPSELYATSSARTMVHRASHRVREITRLTLTTPVPLCSNGSQKIIESGVLATRTGMTSLLEIEFDGHRRKEHADFRPHLAVIFQL